MSDITSSQWITSATIEIDKLHSAMLTLVYLPHLDYCLQKFGPEHSKVKNELKLIDIEVGRLMDHFGHCNIVLLSEYGITPVSQPIDINRTLREHNLLQIRDELDLEYLDCGASNAFAVADHQIAHVYVKNPEAIKQTAAVVQAIRGVAKVYVGPERAEIHLDHPRAGDIVAIAEPDAWFTYYYWFRDQLAPDYARTVDIHRKPGYDPCELFLDPSIAYPKLKIAGKLLRKKLGMRYLMDVIPLDGSLVKGSHGAPPTSPDVGPVVISNRASLIGQSHYQATDIFDLLLKHLQS